MIRIKGEMTPVVDCDVHETLPAIDALYDYLDKPWRRYIDECNFKGIVGSPYTGIANGARRADSWPPTGGPPGSDHGFFSHQHLVEHEIDYAILTSNFYMVSSMPQVRFAVALASAYNDWMIDKWLANDDRLYGSLQVTLQDPKAAAREIDRLGDHPKIVQVVFPQTAQRGFGDESYDPVYEACIRRGLHVAIHPSSTAGAVAPPTITGGWPPTYMEMHSNFALPYQAQVTSMVCEGTFVKFPELRVVLLEAGFYWMPHVRWTLDAHWESLQVEVPWLTKKPSTYIREHFFIGTQPVMLPESIDHFAQMLEMIDGEATLLYASDYPHWDFDAPARALPAQLSDTAKRRILGLNALELYGLPTPATPAGRDAVEPAAASG